MIMEIAFLASLVILLLGSQFFWMRHTQTLVNKLMSRDYLDYAQSEKMLKPQKKRAEKQNVMPQGPNELDALNDYLGMN